MGKCKLICSDKLRAFASAIVAAKSGALAQIGAGCRDAEVLAVVHGGGPAMGDNYKAVSHWDWEITDFSLVPDVFKVQKPDIDALDTYVSLKGGEAEIPGVRVFQTTELKRKRGVLS